MARLWDRWFRREGKTDTLELFREIFGGMTSWAGKEITLQTAMQVSTALACGRVISEGLAMLPWKVMQQSGRDIVPAIAHPLYDKLAVSPNPLQTAYEFVETLGLHAAFCGNAFVWIPTVSGRIDAMYLLEPKWVTVKYQWPDPPRYVVRIDGRAVFELTSAELWHLRGPSWCTYIGLEFMKLARNTLGLAMALEEGQSRLQARGVNMPGYLSVEGTLADDQQKKLKAWIEKEHEGSGNFGRAMILDRAAKWIATGMSNIDGQVLEQRKFAVEEGCRFMRVLPIMIGHTGDKAATYASSEQLFLAHSMYTAGPWARRVEQSADKWLLRPEERKAGYYTKMNEKAVLRMAARDQMEFLARGVLSGIIVRNEAREKLDMNPLEGLDEPLAPANTFVGNPPAGDAPPKVTDNPRGDDA